MSCMGLDQVIWNKFHLVKQQVEDIPLKVMILSKWIMSCLLMLIPILSSGHQSLGDAVSYQEGDVRVYKIRIEYTATIRYLDERGEQQEKSSQRAYEFAFETPISWDDARLLIDSSLASKRFDLFTPSLLDFSVCENYDSLHAGIWWWFGMSHSVWDWQPSLNGFTSWLGNDSIIDK
jgi:hypothetical protein